MADVVTSRLTVVVMVAVFAVGGLVGSIVGALAMLERSAERLAEARASQASASEMLVSCRSVIDRCDCAVAGVRCPK